MFSVAPFLALSLALVAPSAVNAHGYVKELTIGGKQYTGYLPWEDPWAQPQPQRIVRNIPGDGPILDVQSSDLICNKGGQKGSKAVAPVKAGDKVTYQWTSWPADHQGPVDDYMASCNGPCANFDATKAKWFKIAGAGYDKAAGKWAATKLIEAGNKWTVTIPSQIQDGEYLLRTQIVALHDAHAPQFYPSCTQVKVSGGQNQAVPASAQVSIPGLYALNQFPDIWASDAYKNFKVPGPAVAFSVGGNPNPPASPPQPPADVPKPPTNASDSTPPKPPAASPKPPVATPNTSPKPPVDASTSSAPPPSTPSNPTSRRCRNGNRPRGSMLKRHQRLSH